MTIQHTLMGLTAGLCLAAAAACAPAPAATGGLTVENAVVQIPGQAEVGGTAAGYLTVRNQGPADRLVGAACDLADMAHLHVTQMQDNVMSMQAVDAIDLPAGSVTQLAPGGSHVMLVGLKRVVRPGDQVTLTLVFERAGPMTVTAEVRLP